MFQIGDKIVHPMHGAGVIEEIERRDFGGECRDYYLMKLPGGDMLVMIPTDYSQEIGIRAVVDSDYAWGLLSSLPELSMQSKQNWNQRYRENMTRIKSGDLTEVARVVKSLIEREQIRSLSTGERKMLHVARQILLSELVLSLGISLEEAERCMMERLSS